ncbi:ribbon-helix-helix domain-containing protein [Paracraurococcus ruber]|uniref:Uncharacterized protein n=1 Tax=Paracraurococcus ruber TaxID=77675 RepID=A0ABS1CZA6_9PROT|nr:ribbon-helix-helix domain-containing protein [Paracraurococcus ruber]MBK1659865.1 hypothetical protein [Paracraurococcus ruber]
MQRNKGFQPISTGSRLSGDALLRAVETPMATVPPAAVELAQPTVPAKQSQKAVPFMLRLAPMVFQALEEAAEREGTTMTVMIARALRDAGYPVPEADLKDRRRRRDYAALADQAK